MKPLLTLPAWTAILACAALQFSAAVRAETPDKSAALFKDPIVATGKNFEIKRSQVDEAYIDYTAALVASGRAIADPDRALVRSKVLEHMIISKILLQKATEEDKTKIAKLVEDEITQARTNAPSPEAFEQQLKATGMTLAQVRDQATEKQLFQRILLREATNGIVIAEDEVTKYYQDNPDQFKIPERVRVQHILVLTMDPATRQALPLEKKMEKLKLANELKARADKGEDFVALVKQYTDDPGSKDKGGEYIFGRGQQGIALEFEDAAFSMKTNQISDPVETRFGYYIVRLLEKLPVSTEDFAKAAPLIRDHLVERTAEKGLPAYFEKLKAGADVKILDEDGAKPDTAPSGPAAK
jgi:parvulin-like peptidyl-prolyl isomerase